MCVVVVVVALLSSPSPSTYIFRCISARLREKEKICTIGRGYKSVGKRDFVLVSERKRGNKTSGNAFTKECIAAARTITTTTTTTIITTPVTSASNT